MRKESLIIFMLAAVLSLGIVGALHYFYLQNQELAPTPVVAQSQPARGVAKARYTTKQPSHRRTETPIKCTKADGSVFWTNASRCENADLDNRLSYADPVKPVPRVITRGKYQTVANASTSRSRNAKERVRKPVPRDMRFDCSFPIGMAQRIEKKSLRLKDDPAESVWRPTYCKWVCKARRASCENIEDYLLDTRICPRWGAIHRKDCNS